MTQPPYIAPISTVTPPGGLSLTQFIQTVFVGVSGLPGTLVRPLWQTDPPKQPDVTVDWLAMGIQSSDPDFNAYIASTPQDTVISQRMEQLDITCHLYGPNCVNGYQLIRDGLQVPQNLFGLRNNGFGLVEVSRGQRTPDLVNQRWNDRMIFEVVLNYETLRTYPILTLVSASGVIYIPDIKADYMQNFVVNQ